MMTITLRNRIFGTLWGGAVGDALGAPVEFMDRETILRRFSPEGVCDYVEFQNGSGAITDDTQMTLFTAEGILDAFKESYPSIPSDSVLSVSIANAYLRWFVTQTSAAPPQNAAEKDRLLGKPALFRLRAPGNTCLSALRSFQRSGKFGTPELPINQSKGCGTIMRTAPIGLFGFDAEKVFQIGKRASAVTHGHITGILAGAAGALLVHYLAQNIALAESVNRVMKRLETELGSQETLAPLQKAVSLVDSDLADADAIGQLGEGWVAEETLAISVFCALRHPADFRAAVLAAVNITGDSDSTGAVTGNFLGCALGLDAIPLPWRENLQEREILDKFAAKIAERNPNI